MPGRDEILTHPVTMYAKQVTAGRLKKNCGPYEIKACQRHLDDLKRILAPDGTVRWSDHFKCQIESGDLIDDGKICRQYFNVFSHVSVHLGSR